MQDIDHFLGLAIDDINDYKNIKESNFDKQLRLMIQDMVLGKYNPDETTGLGTTGQILLGLTGADAAADVRDLSYDFKNWEWTKEHYGQTALDGIGLLPVFGVLKYIDEAAALAKKSDDITEAITDASKKADDLGDDVADASKGIGKVNPKDIKPPEWNDQWEWRYPEANKPNAKPRWFDPDGGEWRWHAPDKWHPVGHWDYNPWDEWNSVWQNIYPD
ncbi:MAG: hypothetical protein AAGU14_09490 [Eubacteriaceae bacterium]